jgi:hypothetical protein
MFYVRDPDGNALMIIQAPSLGAGPPA